MKKLLVVLAFLASLVGSVCGQDKAGHAGDADHVVVRSAAVKWGPAPPGLPPGAQIGVLLGDPSKPGMPYVLRAKLPAGYKVPPHWHPTDENVTVLQGTLLIGKGDKLDPSTMEELPAGSFMRMPQGMRHYAIAKGETILQLHGMGPFDIAYVNPSDDPRKREIKK
jgi:quercetin dioxygenase-like cupin family protein